MNPVARFVRDTLIGGLLVILPAYLAIVLLLKAVQGLNAVLGPIEATLPDATPVPGLVAIAILVAGAFLLGVSARTAIGRRAGAQVERTFFERIPGYTVIRGLGNRLMGRGEAFAPALVRLDDNELPAFIVERLPDGRVTVFLPSSPTPATGTVAIVTADRIVPLTTSSGAMFSALSRWGEGTGALLRNGQG